MQLLISGSYNAFSDGYNAAGIYLASGLIESDSYTRPIYVGSAVNLKKRLVREHIPQLTCLDHKNKPMQSYAAKYGVENLVWFALETYQLKELLAKELIPLEQAWFDQLTPFTLNKKRFNICEKAGSTAGRYCSNETKAKISNANSGKRISEETKQKLSQAKKGILSSYNKSKRKTYTLLSPLGDTITFTGLNEFCRKNKLSASNICKVINGKIQSHKGWTKP